MRTEFFQKLMDLDASLTENVKSRFEKLVAAAAEDNGGVRDNLSEDLIIMIDDPDIMMSAISSSSDMHVGKLISLEDLTRDALNTNNKGIVNSIVVKEKERSRKVVDEIRSIVQGKQTILRSL